MRWMILAATLTLTVGSATGQAAQIYKWVDAQGITHFDAQPPAGQSAQEIDVQKPVTPPPAAPATRAGPDQEQQAADAKVKRQVAAQEAKRKEYCETQRTNLAQLQNNPRVREEVNGEFRRFTEEERQARIAEVRKSIDDTCN
jgi:molecular chaperone DnaK (HSP70)